MYAVQFPGLSYVVQLPGLSYAVQLPGLSYLLVPLNFNDMYTKSVLYH